MHPQKKEIQEEGGICGGPREGTMEIQRLDERRVD